MADALALHIGGALVEADDLVAIGVLLVEEAMRAALLAQRRRVSQDGRKRLVLMVEAENAVQD